MEGLHEYYSMETQEVDFFQKKFEINDIEFFQYPECPYPKKRNRPGFVLINPTLVIYVSMEWSSRVLQHRNMKI